MTLLAVGGALSEVLDGCRLRGDVIAGKLGGRSVEVTRRPNGWVVSIELPELPLRLIADGRSGRSDQFVVTWAPSGVRCESMLEDARLWAADPVLLVVIADRRLALLCDRRSGKAMPEVVRLAGRLVVAARRVIDRAAAEMTVDSRGDAYRMEVDDTPRRERARQWQADVAAFEGTEAFRSAVRETEPPPTI
jgi:hypothetical protein